jgi:predicted phage tail protein
MEMKLYSVNLYGSLGNDYTTETIKIYAKDIKSVFAGLCSRFGDTFQSTILHGSWHITTGKRKSQELSEYDKFLSEELIDFPLEENELHVFPAIQGAGGKGGIGQIILGVVLIVVAVVVVVFAPEIAAALGPGLAEAGGAGVASAGAQLALVGALSLAGGIMTMLTKTPSMSNYGAGAGAQQHPSFIFNGAVNNTVQGVPVPLVYGRHLTGSTVIYAGMYAESAVSTGILLPGAVQYISFYANTAYVVMNQPSNLYVGAWISVVGAGVGYDAALYNGLFTVTGVYSSGEIFTYDMGGTPVYYATNPGIIIHELYQYA